MNVTLVLSCHLGHPANPLGSLIPFPIQFAECIDWGKYRPRGRSTKPTRFSRPQAFTHRLGLMAGAKREHQKREWDATSYVLVAENGEKEDQVDD